MRMIRVSLTSLPMGNSRARISPHNDLPVDFSPVHQLGDAIPGKRPPMPRGALLGTSQAPLALGNR